MALGTWGGQGAEAGKVFRAGTRLIDITPASYPVLVNAMFTERIGTNVADRLHVRALALDDGSTRIAFAVVDSCMVARDLIDRAKEQASRITGIPVERMLVSSTHTHSAPSAMGCLGSRMDTNYARFLEPRIAAAIVGAVSNLAPAEIGWGSVDDWEHTHNRRWIRRPDKMLTDPFGQTNVRAHMHPGHESPDAVGPSGPVDPMLSVIALRHPDGRPLALLGNYSQHYYGSPLLSSDYYGRFCGYVAALLKTTHGGGPEAFLPIMSQGTSGDLMWMNYAAPAREIGYDAYAKEMAEEAVGVVRGLRFHSWVPLRMAERTLALNYRFPDDARLAWARKLAGSFEGRLPRTLPEVYALESIYLHERPRTELKLQAIGIGELGVAALPNEVFALTGLKLKAQSPFPHTFNIELANGAEGYIPPPEQHELGGYTTWPARTAGLEVQAEPRIVETLLSLLEEVSGKPRRPMVAPVGEYPRAVLQSKPTAYWRLNESVVPTAADASGHGRAATFESGIALYLPGASGSIGFQNPRPEAPNAFSEKEINRAPHFAGGRLRAAVPLPRDRYSVELWLWNGLPTSLRSVTGYFFSRGTDETYGAPGEHLAIGGTRASPGHLIFSNGGSDASQSLVGRTELGLRRWHHVVLVREGRQAKLYLNGDPTPDASGELEAGVAEGVDQIFVGGRSDRVDGFEGRLDEVALYARALTAEEVSAHYQASRIPKPIQAARAGANPTPAPALTLGLLRPTARWFAPASEGSTVWEAGREFSATAESGVELPAAEALSPRFTGGRLRSRMPGLGASYTVAFWFFNELPNASRPVTAYLFSRGKDGADGAPGDHLGIGGSFSDAGKLILFNGNSRNALLAGRTVVAPQQWHHVVMVRDARRARVYLDGQTTPEIEGEIEPGYAPGTEEIFWGGRSDNFANLQGRLFDVALFNRALSVEELKTNMTSIEVSRPLTPAGSESGGRTVSASVVPPLAPAESLAKLRLREGFVADLVASEPLLESPVAIDWDERGRLWVVEMLDYPLGLDGKGQPGGRVRILEDVDGDGRYDRTTLFAEGLRFPTGILTWRDGVLVTAAPEILFLRDTDGDGRADEKRVLFSGFFEGNQQLRVNGLRWGLDNWVYCASGSHHGGYGTATRIRSHLKKQDYAIGSRDFRFRPDTGELEPESGPSQFGRNPDDWGNWFGVQNSWPLWHYVLPDRYLRRNPHNAAPSPVHQVITPNNPPVYPASQREKRFHSFGEAGHFTSACSAMIYRDELLFGAGQLRHAFTCEPFHNLVQHNLIREDGVSFAASRAKEEAAYDFFASEDRWCRPVMARTGPDGALWVVDMYRYMIEHPEWLPAEGKAELLPHYRLGENRGRIYRVYPRGPSPRPPEALGKLGVLGWVAQLESTNGWVRDKAQMLLVWRQDKAAVPSLEALARNGPRGTSRIQALCVLEGLGVLSPKLVVAALSDASAEVRRAALRLAENQGEPEVVQAAIRLVEDPEVKVRLQLAFSLGEWKAPAAGVALGRLAVSHSEDKFFQAAIMSSALPHGVALTEAVVRAGGTVLATWTEPLAALCLATGRRDSLARLLSPVLKPIGGRFAASQLEACEAFLDSLARRKLTWQQLERAPAATEDELAQTLSQVPRLMSAARGWAMDPQVAMATRVSAARFLAREDTDRSLGLSVLAGMLTPQTPVEAQRAAILALGRTGADEVPGLLGKSWDRLSPEMRRTAIDQLLTREAWCMALVDLLAAGRVHPSALDATRAGRLLRHTSARVRDAAQKVVATGEASTRSQVLESFRAAIRLEGDARRGTAVFARSCSVCHKLGSLGNEIGPNLISVANHPAEKLLVSILDPNASIEPGYTGYTAELPGGEELYGLIAAETDNSLVFKLADGKSRTVLRSEIASLRSSNLSLMPEGLEAGLALQDVADLIRFIQSGEGR